jgi:hypothetical protein
MTDLILSLSLMYLPTVSRPVCLGIKHPSGVYDKILLVPRSCGFVDVRRSLRREDGSVVYNCCWPRQRRRSRIPVSRDSWQYFTLSDSRLLFSSPPTTRMATVEVFDYASTLSWLDWSWTASYIAYPSSRKRPVIPHRRVDFQDLISVEAPCIFLSQESCSIMSWFPRIYFYGNVFINSFPSNGYTCHNMLKSSDNFH